NALVVPVMSYGWPLWAPPTNVLWRKLESVVCLPLRCCLGLPRSVEKLALLSDFGVVRPSLLRDCLSLTYAHRVDNQLATITPRHPAHVVFRQQANAALPPWSPRYRIPFAKAVKKQE